jgi:hypothetical protein
MLLQRSHGLGCVSMTCLHFTGGVLCRPENVDENGTCLVPLFKPVRGDSVDIRGYVQQKKENRIGGLSIRITSMAKAGVFAPTPPSPKEIQVDYLRGGFLLEKVRTLLMLLLCCCLMIMRMFDDDVFAVCCFF